MSLLFTNPALYAFAALVAVPVLAHLFAKTRPREQPFPSLQWLRQVERRTTNLRKPKDYALLMLRTLAVAAIIAAFLQPLLFQGARLGSSQERKTLVLVVDRSASMNALDQGQSRFARALAQATEVLRGSGSRSLANVVWMDAQPAAVFPDPAVNVDALRESLRQASSTLEHGDVASALRVAMDQIGRGEGAKELYLISDFQSTNWSEAKLGVPPNVRVFKINTAKAPVTNAALPSLVVQPERPVAGTEARVICRVRNFSDAELKTTVQLAFGEVRQSRPVTLSAWGEGVAEFRVPCATAGLQAVTASLPEDAFPADDRRHGLIEVRESWRAQVQGPAKDASALMWQRGLSALGWLDVKASDRFDVIVAAHSDAALASEWREAAGQGALVIVQPEASWSGTPWMALWGGDAKSAAITTEARQRDRDKPWALKVATDSHPLWQIFAGGQYGDPAAASAWRRMKVNVEDANVLMRYADGVVALAAQRVGKGWLVLWNIDLDEAVADTVQQPSFLVLLGELLLQHGEGGGRAALRSFGTEQLVRWPVQQAVAEDQVQFQDSTGASMPFTYDASAHPPMLRSTKPLPPGSYRWLVNGQVVERSVVHFPADTESDLRGLNPDGMGVGESLSLDATSVMVAQRDGEPLWPWCLGAAAVLLLLEGLLARVKSSQTEVKEAATT